VCNKLKDDAKVRIQSLSANPATYGPLLESLIMEVRSPLHRHLVGTALTGAPTCDPCAGSDQD
jgi:hypothetical protein